MKCPNCGKEIANDSKFCEYCGTLMQEKVNKRVDIRWMLLPALVVAMLVVFNFSRDPESAELVHGIIAGTPIILIFIASLWFGIKKMMPYSFIVIVGLVMVTNLWMLYACMDRNKSMYTYLYRPGATIFFRDNGELKIIKMEDFDYAFSYSSCEEKTEQFQKYSHVVVRELIRQGEKDVKEFGDINEYFLPNGLYRSLIIIEFCWVLLYIIYALMAEKNKWKF